MLKPSVGRTPVTGDVPAVISLPWVDAAALLEAVPPECGEADEQASASSVCQTLDELEARNCLEMQMLSLLIGRRRRRLQLEAVPCPVADFSIRPKAA